VKKATIAPWAKEETRLHTMDDQSSQFLDAYNGIEKHLRKIVRSEKHLTFGEIVEKASRTSRPVTRYRDGLKEFGDLRNFLVHQYRRTDPLALPSPATVDRIRRIRDELVSPPKLIDVCSHKVETCSPADLIGAAARRMHEGSFSQLPVYPGGEFAGLLTAETVSRWLANRLARGEGIIEEETVEEVLRHGEDIHECRLMGRDATVFDAMAAFDDLVHAGKVLDAIILTHGGKSTESPLGIVTVADVPRLNRLITP
jgi:predicted transcriptional regulator